LEPDEFMVSWLAGSASLSDLAYTRSRNTALEPVPEPTTLVLWGVTAAGLGFLARRRRNRQASA
jgi:hypothetical protein